MKTKKQDKMLQIRIPSNLHDYLMEMCSLGEVTLSRYVRDLLLLQASLHRGHQDFE